MKIIKNILPTLSLILAALLLTPTTMVLAGTPIQTEVPSGNATLVLMMPEKPPKVVSKVADLDASKLQLGQVVVTGTNSYSVYLGDTLDSKGKPVSKFTANIGGPQYLEDLTTRIVPQWEYVSPYVWKSGPNLFFAGVAGEWIEVTYNDQKFLWRSKLLVGGVEYKVKSINPTLVFQDPLNKNYYGNTLQWDYGIAKRNIRIIEGVISEYWTVDKDPKLDIQIVTEQTKDTGFVWEKPPWAMDANNVPIPITSDRIVKASDLAKGTLAYPIIIDPTTTFTTSASDGYIAQSGGNYNTAWASATGTVYAAGATIGIGQYEGPVGFYGIFRGYPYFDTSSIPDASVITAGTLKIYGASDFSAADFFIQIQNGMPTYPHDPLATGDYNKANYSGAGGTLTTVGFSTAAYNSVSLNAAALSWVDKTGYTKFVLRSTEEIGASLPAGNEYVTIWAYEKGTGYWPQLELTYTVYSGPTVTQQAASDISSISAVGHGTITEDGGDTNSWANFWWGTTTGGPYGQNTTRIYGLSTGETFQATIPNLTLSTTYYMIVTAGNSFGTANSTQVSFTTMAGPGVPTGFGAIPQSDEEIALKWVKGTGSDRTVIVYMTGTYPASPTSGTVAYNGTESSYALKGLEPGTTYYFRVWGWSNGFSTTNITEVATTWPLSTVGSGILEPPDAPDDWVRPPTYATMTYLPIYPFINAAADSMEMPRETMWLLFAVGVSVLLGVIAYVLVPAPWMALAAGGVGMGWGWSGLIVPGFIMAIYILAAGFLIYLNMKGGQG